jgi:putative redox protein
LLLAGLGACTAIALRMYADRKQWNVGQIGVSLHYLRDGESERIHRKLQIAGNITAAQRARMADIAERTPVTLTLKRGLQITTELEPPVS